MNQSLVNDISSSLLFRFRFSCLRQPGEEKRQVDLGPRFVIPDISPIPNSKPFAELRMAWNPQGLLLWMEVSSKKQSLWCRKSDLLSSDGLQIWLDSRNTNNVHRATKFCHWFVLLPSENGDSAPPLATMLKINRSREDSPSINRAKIPMTANIHGTGYQLAAFIPGAVINGWDTTEQRMLGFCYQIVDRELGILGLGLGPEYPIAEDPSLWSTLVLTG